MKLKNIKIFSLFTIFTLTGIFNFNTLAATTESLTLEPILTTSNLSSQIVGQTSYTYLDPLNDSQTQITNEDEGHWYAWSFNVLDQLPCPSATMQSIRVVASNTLETEGNPDWAVMVLANIEDDSITPLLPTKPVTEGYSPDLLPYYVGRWSEGVSDFPPATTEWGIGIAGPMEAIWEVSGLDINNDFALAIGHDAEDGTVGLQTNIQAVEVTFDDSSCDGVPAPTTPGGSSSLTPSTPKTGTVSSVIIATSIAIAAIFLTLKTAKRLKSKH